MQDLRICHAAFSLGHVFVDHASSYPSEAYETNARTLNNAICTSTISKNEKFSA